MPLPLALFSGVTTTPGAMALTRIPRWPHSTAIVAVRFSTPALAAPYWPVIGLGCEPLREDTLMIVPPRGDGSRDMDRAAAWQAKKVPLRLRSVTASH